MEEDLKMLLDSGDFETINYPQSDMSCQSGGT